MNTIIWFPAFSIKYYAVIVMYVCHVWYTVLDFCAVHQIRGNGLRFVNFTVLMV